MLISTFTLQIELVGTVSERSPDIPGAFNEEEIPPSGRNVCEPCIFPSVFNSGRQRPFHACESSRADSCQTDEAHVHEIWSNGDFDTLTVNRLRIGPERGAHPDVHGGRYAPFKSEFRHYGIEFGGRELYG